MMRCLSCFTSWTDLEDFDTHLRAHDPKHWQRDGLTVARVVAAAEFAHKLVCKCTMRGVKFTCEILTENILKNELKGAI